MDWLLRPYLASLYMSAILPLGLAIVIWWARKRMGVAISSIVILFAITLQAAGNAYLITYPDSPFLLTVFKVLFLTDAVLPTAWFVFVLQFIGRGVWLDGKRALLLVIQPVVVAILAITDTWHNWLWSGIYLDESGLVPLVRPLVSSGYWLHAAYSYLLILWSIFLLANTAHHSSPLIRRQSAIILVGVSLPFAAHAAYTFGWGAARAVNLSPLAFMLTSLLVAWNLRRFWLYDIVPVARSTVIEGMKAGILVLDMRGRIVDANPAACQFLGKPFKKVVGISLSDVFPLLAALLEPEGGKDTGAPSVEIKTEITTGQGEELRYFDLAISPLMDRQGELTGRLVIWNDITERHREDETLREREARLQLVVSQLPAVLWTTDAQLRFTSILGAGLVDLNLHADTLIGKSVTLVGVQGEATTASIIAHRRALEGIPSPYQELWNGQVYQCYVEPLHSGKSEVIGTVGIGIDVTNRQMVERALADSEERYRQSVEQSPNPIFSTDQTGRIITWNKACENIFEYRQDIVGRYYHEILLEPEQAGQLDGFIKRVFTEKTRMGDINLAYRTYEGSVRYMVARLYPVIRQGGKVESCVFANTDITERIMAERALRRQLEELSMLNAVGTACVEAASEDELIERVTDVIGNSVYMDNLGVLLVDEANHCLFFHPSYRGLPEQHKSHTLSLMKGVAGQVALSGAAARVSDSSMAAGQSHVYFQTRSELCVPIKIGGRVIAVLNLESRQVDAFSEADERMLTTIAGQIATAIERLRAEAAERRRVEELLAITRLSSEITSVLDRQELFQSIVRNASDLSNSDACGLFLIRPDNRFYLVSSYGVGEAFVERINQEGVPKEGTAVGRAFREIKPIQIHNIQTDPQYTTGNLAEMEGIVSILALPLLLGKDPIGGIVLWSRQVYVFSQEEIVFVQAIAQQSVNALENARLFDAERSQRKLAEFMRGVATTLTASLDLETVLDHLLDQAEWVVPFNLGIILVAEADEAYSARYKADSQFADLLEGALPGLQLALLAPPLEGLCSSGKPQIIPDLADSPHVELQLDQPALRSWIGAPIMVNERVAAIFCLYSVTPGFYDEEHSARLASLAGQAALALQNARLFHETHQRASHLEALNAVIAAASGANDLPQMLGLALQATLTALDLHQGIIRIGSQVIFHGLPDHLLPDSMLLAEYPHRSMQPVWVDDWYKDEYADLRPRHSALLEAGIRATIAAPIAWETQLIGGLVLASVHPRRWSADELGLVEAVARQLGAASERLGLLEETQRRLREVTLFSKVITSTAVANDLPSALNAVCAEVAYFFHSPQTTFALFNAERSAAVITAEYCEQGRQSGMGLEIPIPDNPVFAIILDNKMPLAIEDVDRNTQALPLREVFHVRGVASLLLAPIFMDGEVTGILQIDSPQPRLYDPADIALVCNIASHVSQALERMQLFNAARERAVQMARLAALSGDLNRPFTTQEVIQGIGEGAMTLAQADRAAIFIRSLPERIISCDWRSGISKEYTDKAVRNVQNLPGGSLAVRPEPVLTADTENLPDNLLKEMARTEGFRAVALWPLVYEGEVRAAIGCYYNSPHDWPAQQREVMLAFTRQAAVALQNALLFDEIRRRAAQQEALNAIIAAAVMSPDLQSLLNEVLDLTLCAFGLTQGSLWVDEFSVLRGLPEEIGKISARISHMDGSRIDHTIVIGDWRARKDSPYTTLMLAHQLHATLIVPVMAAGRRIGGMSLVSEQPRQWRQEDIALAEAVGRQVGGAVERLNLLAKTQEQARQVQQIMDTVPDGVVLLDAERKIVLTNPAAVEYLAVLAPEHQSTAPLDFLASEAVAQLLQPPPPDRSWHEAATAGPIPRIFETAARPIESVGQQEGWVLVIRDVTVDRETQERIQMQERLATVGQLAAGIAHDFNNIMAAIVVYADLLIMDAHLSPSSRDRLAIIQQQVQRATSLIRQILDFSRRSIMEQSEMDLLPFIKELDRLLGRVLPENIRLDLTYQPGLYFVKADPTRMQQVFMNLALNARDAMSNGGSLTFALSRLTLKPDDTLPYPGLSTGAWIKVEVRDTGAGIAPEALPHIFDPFFTTKPVGQGTGLGLAQVYGIVKGHQGSIDVRSQVGSGTVFTLYLPALKLTTPPETAVEEDVLLQGEGETVLLAEDDQAAREALEALLSSQNYRVLSAENGVEALRLYRAAEAEVALVVTDIVMPEMGGLALYDALQAYRPGVRVLFMTGHPLDEQNRVLLEKGCIHWLQKPFTIKTFMQAVQAVLA